MCNCTNLFSHVGKCLKILSEKVHVGRATVYHSNVIYCVRVLYYFGFQKMLQLS